MSLSNLLKEIESNQVNANIDLNDKKKVPPATYGGHKGLKVAAIENIRRLKIDYRNKLLSSTVFIVVTGPAKDEFAQLASNETFGCFSADPDALFKEMTSKIDPTLFGREGVNHLFGIASRVLEDKANELDITSYPMLMFNEKYNKAVRKAEELVPLLRAAVVDQVGSELVGLNAIYSLVDQAIEKKHEAEVTPVVFNTSDEAFALDLSKNLKRLSKSVFLVVAGKLPKTLVKLDGVIPVKTVNEESVGQALSSIRSKVVG